MKHCYSCNTPIIEANRSKEHVLLNAIGGRLKSSEILCVDCNREFSDSIDDVLASQLSTFANMLNIKRDRGEPPKIKTFVEGTGEEYYLEPGGVPRLAKPNIATSDSEPNKVDISISAADRKQLKQLLSGLKRKYPQIDVDACMQKAENRKEFLAKPMKFEMAFGGIDAFRSITKTAVNLFILKGGAPQDVKDAIDFIRYGTGDARVWMYYPDPDVIIDRVDGRVMHSIVVRSNQKERILYAYIEFFNSTRFLICMSEDYEGPALEIDYFYDVLTCNEVTHKASLTLTADELKNALKLERPNYEAIQRANSELMKIIVSKQSDEERSRMIERAINKSFRRHPEGIPITKEMVAELAHELTQELLPYIVRGAEQDEGLNSPPPTSSSSTARTSMSGLR